MSDEAPIPPSHSESRDRYMDALLSQRFENPESMRARIDALSRRLGELDQPRPLRLADESRQAASIGAATALLGAATANPSAAPARRRLWGWESARWLAAAALLALAFFLITPGRAGAEGLLHQAASAEKSGGDRRYSMRIEAPPQHAGRPDLNATLDVRDATHVLLSLTLPDGATTIRALDGNHAWERAPDGGVNDLNAGGRWPRWVQSSQGTLLVDTIESMLDNVATNYAVTIAPDEALDGAPMKRLNATLRKTDSAAPDVREPAAIRLWIDAGTHQVRRAVLEWTHVAAGDGERPPPPPPGFGEHPPPPPGEGGPPPRGAVPTRGAMPMGPPGRVTIDRLSAPPFAEGWFAPESHKE